MGDRHDYVALEWVKGEIAETLKQAHHAIETLLDDPQATPRWVIAWRASIRCTAVCRWSNSTARPCSPKRWSSWCAHAKDRVSHRDEGLHLLMQALGNCRFTSTGCRAPAATCRWWCCR
jgi:chemosensory pili system protein ChpA (sensor histidine kinase/response regulator)